MKFETLIEDLQTGMNSQGEKLKVDGDPGPKTKASLAKFDVKLNVTRKVLIPEIDNTKPALTMAHLKWFEDRLGWNEANLTQNRELSKGWPLTKYCKKFTSISGRERAWCGMSGASAFHFAKMRFPEQNETASEWIGSGVAYDYKKTGIKKGSIIVKRDGGYHICFAYEDAAPGAEYVKCIGGNQNNEINVTPYKISKFVYVGMPIALAVEQQVLTTGQDIDEGTEPWYRKMFAACTIDAGKETQVKNSANLVLKGMPRYLEVAKRMKAEDPENFAMILGAVHFKEASCDFRGVLHNGQKIVGTGEKTTIVPVGRGPFATWEDAAVDAIKGESSRWNKLIAGGKDIGDILYALERYNGTGYITGKGKEENSPYLWACSNINDNLGKYVSDGKFDATQSTQSTVGAAVILKELQRMGKFEAA